MTYHLVVVEPKDSRIPALPDFLNPVFVRELQQSLKGKAFAFTMLLALAAVLTIAVVTATDPNPGSHTGRRAFDASITAMTVIVVLLVPLQAFLSMREEMRGGGVEILLLANLTPSRIVKGKILAAFAHFLLYVGIFAPLFAFTFLLRGVDVPAIAFTLGVEGLACLVASRVAVLLGAVMHWQQLARFVPRLALLVGLVGPVLFMLVQALVQLFPLIAPDGPILRLGILVVVAWILVKLVSARAEAPLIDRGVYERSHRREALLRHLDPRVPGRIRPLPPRMQPTRPLSGVVDLRKLLSTREDHAS